jgi:hypothetical protein
MPSSLSARLSDPARTLTLPELAEAWFQQSVEVRLPGLGVQAAEPAFAGKVRGAWGHALMGAASPEALAGRPCPWDPPCALSVLFNEQARLMAGMEVPRPYRITARPHGADALVRLTLYGFACDWMTAAAEALTIALRERLELPRLGRGAPGPVMPGPRRLETMAGIVAPTAAEAVEITLDSPADLTGDTLPLERFGGFVTGLGRRVAGLARWQDAAVSADWRTLKEAADALPLRRPDLLRVAWERRSDRQGGRPVPMSGVVGTIYVDGLAAAGQAGAVAGATTEAAGTPPPLLSLLALAPHVGVGKGTTRGLGTCTLRFIGGG